MQVSTSWTSVNVAKAKAVRTQNNQDDIVLFLKYSLFRHKKILCFQRNVRYAPAIDCAKRVCTFLFTLIFTQNFHLGMNIWKQKGVKVYGLKRSGFKKQRERPLSLPYYGHTLLASALSTSAASFSRQSALIYSILARLVALPGTDVHWQSLAFCYWVTSIGK